MKKLIIIVVFGTILFSSCRKSYYCYCTNEDDDEVTQMLSGKITKNNAEEQCNTMQFLYSEMEVQCEAREI